MAIDAGYSTHEAFTRAFRQHFGVSPTEFRNHKRGPVQVPALAMEIAAMTEPTAETSYEVRLIDRSPQRVAFLRHVGPLHRSRPHVRAPRCLGRPRGVFGPRTQMLGVCHDDPKLTPADKLRYDCCVTVPDHIQPEGEVGVMILEGGPHAVITHKGPYTKLGQAYDSGSTPHGCPPAAESPVTPRPSRSI